jgi:hypothetical protein
LTKGERKVTKNRKVTKIKKSHKDKNLSCKGGERYCKGERMTLEKDLLKLSAQVGEQAHE